MKSVRLGDPLEGRLKRAAEVSRISESEVIRQAVTEKCDAILGTSLYDMIRDVIGVVDSGRSGPAPLLDDLAAEELARRDPRWR